ncbi:uncharacterized protein V1510DRAFT_116554 [Dipodascopsis tothii]|uniref:uncharacterized protein n=1 Tax=Dipodascopsis tothii TaxID=44089 RepID=UPI0034CF0EB7
MTDGWPPTVSSRHARESPSADNPMNISSITDRDDRSGDRPDRTPKSAAVPRYGALPSLSAAVHSYDVHGHDARARDTHGHSSHNPQPLHDPRHDGSDPAARYYAAAAPAAYPPYGSSTNYGLQAHVRSGHPQDPSGVALPPIRAAHAHAMGTAYANYGPVSATPVRSLSLPGPPGAHNYYGRPQPGYEFMMPPGRRSMDPEIPQDNVQQGARRPKTHVASACSNCKKAHLACNGKYRAPLSVPLPLLSATFFSFYLLVCFLIPHPPAGMTTSLTWPAAGLLWWLESRAIAGLAWHAHPPRLSSGIPLRQLARAAVRLPARPLHRRAAPTARFPTRRHRSQTTAEVLIRNASASRAVSASNLYRPWPQRFFEDCCARMSVSRPQLRTGL